MDIFLKTCLRKTKASLPDMKRKKVCPISLLLLYMFITWILIVRIKNGFKYSKVYDKKKYEMSYMGLTKHFLGMKLPKWKIGYFFPTKYMSKLFENFQCVALQNFLYFGLQAHVYPTWCKWESYERLYWKQNWWKFKNCETYFVWPELDQSNIMY